MSQKVVTRCIEIDGIELEIVAQETSKQEWQLAVRNPLGIMTVWCASFPTANDAIDAGLKAVEREGLAEFMDLEGFEYVFH